MHKLLLSLAALLFAALLFRQEKLSLRKLLGCLIGFPLLAAAIAGGLSCFGF